MNLVHPPHRHPDAHQLYEKLRNSNSALRRELTSPILDDLLIQGSRNGRAFAALCDIVVKDVERPLSLGKTQPALRHGEFLAPLSALLGKPSKRIRGFGAAIKRASNVSTFVDLGTGATGILSLLTAHNHQGSQGMAVEINEHAAESAAEMTRLFGVDDRVNVVHSDATKIKIPSGVDLGVTETYNTVLSDEPGTALSHRLRHSRILLPSVIMLNATDAPQDPEIGWQSASRIDLRDSNPQVTGTFRSTRAGRQFVYAYAEYHGDTGPILTNPDDDTITQAALLGSVDVRTAGNAINFSYTPGTSLSGIHSPRLWETQ